MIGSHRWTELVTAQHDSGSRWRGVMMGADVFSDLINISTAVALVTLLLVNGWIAPGLNSLAFAALIILAAAALSFLSATVARRSSAALRIGSSVNDNVPSKPAPGAELADALRRSRSAFLGVGLLSGLINILMLTGPLFMLQIYDRVLPSHNIPTLVGLAILTAGLFLFQGILDAIRGRVLMRIGGAINDELSGRAYDVVARLPLKTRGGGDGLQPIRDLDQIRSFLSSAGPSALFDLPWMPLYVGICFLFHPLIGIAAAFGALILIVLTIAVEAVTRAPAKAAVGFAATRHALLEASRRNAEVMQAMGMGGAMSARFSAVNDDYQRSHRHASDRASILGRHLPRHASGAAVFGARPWRLSRDQSGGNRRRHHCKFHPHVARACSGRACHRQLEGFCGRASGASTPLRNARFAATRQAAIVAAKTRSGSFGRVRSAPAHRAMDGSSCRISPLHSRAAMVSASSVQVPRASLRWRGLLSAFGSLSGARCGLTAQPSTNGRLSTLAGISAICRKMSSCSTARSPKILAVSKRSPMPMQSLQRPNPLACTSSW